MSDRNVNRAAVAKLHSIDRALTEQAELLDALQELARLRTGQAIARTWDPATADLRKSIENLKGRLQKIGSRPALAGRATHRAHGTEARSADELVKAARDAINTMS